MIIKIVEFTESDTQSDVCQNTPAAACSDYHNAILILRPSTMYVISHLKTIIHTGCQHQLWYQWTWNQLLAGSPGALHWQVKSQSLVSLIAAGESFLCHRMPKAAHHGAESGDAAVFLVSMLQMYRLWRSCNSHSCSQPNHWYPPVLLAGFLSGRAFLSSW